MLRIFRQIRMESLTQHRLTRYLLYALGEIILVVIGILIALQINTWNNERILRNKEHAYLKQIDQNLLQDSLTIQKVLAFNAKKEVAVNGMISLFSDTLTNNERFEIFDSHTDNFVMYQIFEPTQTAFRNMLSAQSIDMISDQKLQELLSKYYEFDYKGGVQERIKGMNRRVIDNKFHLFFSREFVLKAMRLSTALPANEEIVIHKDQQFLSDLYGVSILLNMQNDMMRATLEQNDELRSMIANNLRSR